MALVKRHWKLAVVNILILCAGIAALIYVMARPLPKNTARADAAPTTQPRLTRAFVTAATQRAATRVSESAAHKQALVTYGRLQGEVSFMQDHLARTQSQGRPDADLQSIQSVINDLQNQVQTAAAATQPAQ